MSTSTLRAALLGLLSIATAAAQDQTGRIEGVVLDSASHQPVKKATVTINFMGPVSAGTENQAPPAAATDSTGAFSFSNLTPGEYQLIVQHQNYPPARMGGHWTNVRVTAGETAPKVNVELVPGAIVSGRIVDEEGDPLNGCIVQPRPARNINEGVPMMRLPMTREDGSYRIFGIPPGKYTITAHCSESVFQARPLSEGPDPPPASAYPALFYPAARDVKSAQILELSAGVEKSGVDFQMAPVAVTRIHGRLAAGSADWRGRNDIRVQLVPLDSGGPRFFGFAGGEINPKDGTFELNQVFPGSYRLIAFSQDFGVRGPQASAGDRVGAVLRVEVADKPIELSLPLHRAVDIAGTIEIERANKTADPITPSQLNFQLTSDDQFGGPPPITQIAEDGSFTIKSVPPGEWRVRLFASSAFVKSIRFGVDDVTNRPMDLTSGTSAPLRIVVGTDTATIRGTGPPEQMVFCAPAGEADQFQGSRASQVNSNGQFAIQGLAPGKYRVSLGVSAPVSEEAGQEVTVGEGETATIDLKPETKSSIQ